MERKWFLTAVLVLCVAALYAAERRGWAQEQGSGQPVKVSTLGLASVNNLLGKDVTDRQGMRLAHIGGILLARDSIAYLILYIPVPGGTWRHVPVPASKTEFSGSADAVVIDLNDRGLSDAPSYAGNMWLDFSDLEWEQQIRSYYGESPPDRAMESYIVISR